MLLEFSNSSSNHVRTLALAAVSLLVGAFGLIRSERRTRYLWSLAVIVVPACLWSAAVLYSRESAAFDRPIEGQLIAAPVFLWTLLVAPIAWCWFAVSWKKRPATVDVLFAVALALSCLSSAWTALLGMASI